LPGTLLLLSLLAAIGPALASDRNQPVYIEADRSIMDEKTGANVYEGNVYLRQGSLELHGSKMTVQLDGNAIDTLVLTGDPASYRQRPEGKEFDQHAEAGRIEYYAKEDRIVLLENARAWRSNGKEIHSDRIVYDLNSDTVSAGSSKPGDRVQITLPPDSTQHIPPTPP